MTSRFKLTPPAIRDLRELVGHLRRVSTQETSRRFAPAARATFERYDGMPGLGERHETANPVLAGLRVGRVDGFENYVLYYRPLKQGIEIVRVLHGARDADRALGESGP